MRRNRILYVILLIMSFIFVYFHGGKVPYMLFYTVIALPIVSFMHIIMGYLLLKFEQSLNSGSVMKGEKIKLKVSLINKGVFILPYVSIRLFSSRGAFMQQSVIKNISIQPFNKKEYYFEHVYRYRGSYPMGVSLIEIQDFLGIFKLRRKIKKPIKLTVYPKIVNIQNMRLNTQYLPDQRSNLSSLYEDVSVIDEINKYNYGDSLKKVHWKLTAKVNELMVKKYESSTGSNAIFIMDLSKNNFGLEKNVIIEDKHIEVVIAVLRSSIQSGTTVKLVYHDEEVWAIENKNLLDFENAYQALAKVKFNQKIDIQTIINSQITYGINKPELLISTSNVNEEIYEILFRLAAEGYDIRLIYISPEEMTGEKKQDVKQTLSDLSESGIRVYTVNMSDDIADVFDDGGR